jgi:opacity protein-like surface antigen
VRLALRGFGLGALAALAAAACAQAQDLQASGPNWYAGLDFGYHLPATIDSRSTGAASDGRPFDWRWRLNNDWTGMAVVGGRLTPHVRVDLQGAYLQSGVNRIQAPSGDGRPGEPLGLCSAVVGGACVRPFGRADIFSLFGSVIYDVAPERRLDPFFGLGVGVTHIQFHGTYAFSNAPGPTSPQNPPVQQLQLGGTVDEPTQASAQAQAGLAYRLSRHVSLDLIYRALAAPFLRWNTNNNTPGVPRSSGQQPGDFHGALADQSMTLGFRYGF